MQDQYCNYSFHDLFSSAFFRAPTPQEMENFSKLSQDQKNYYVLNWATIAGWKVKEIKASDGKTYFAFSPKPID